MFASRKAESRTSKSGAKKARAFISLTESREKKALVCSSFEQCKFVRRSNAFFANVFSWFAEQSNAKQEPLFLPFNVKFAESEQKWKVNSKDKQIRAWLKFESFRSCEICASFAQQSIIQFLNKSTKSWVKKATNNKKSAKIAAWIFAQKLRRTAKIERSFKICTFLVNWIEISNERKVLHSNAKFNLFWFYQRKKNK